MRILAAMALWSLVLITLGRIPELFPVLAPLQLGKVVVALGLIALFATNPVNITALLKDTPMGRGLLVLLLLSFAGIPFSVFKSGALETFISLCRMLLVVSILTGLSPGGRAEPLRNACIWTLLLVAALMILDKGTGRVQVSNTYDPNDLALFLVVYLPIAANEALAGGRWMKIAALAASLCAVIAIPLTGSRGGIIAIAAVGLQAAFRIKKRRYLLIPALILAAAIIGLTADNSLWERFQDLQNNTDYNLDAKTGRITIWKEGLRLMLAHPLLGVGIGQFSNALGMLGNGAWKAAHNSFIQIGTELGLAGLATFCAIIVSVYRLAKKGETAPFLPPQERQRFSALRISLTGYCAGGFFLSQAYGFIFFIFLALAASMHLEFREAERAAKTLPAPGTRPDDGPVSGLTSKQAPEPGKARARPSRPRTPSGFPAISAMTRRRKREERLLRGDMLYLRAQGKEGKA